MEKIKMHSQDLIERNIELIQSIFPAVIAESLNKNGLVIRSIDFDLLKQELSAYLVDGDMERYQLDWPGKKKSLLIANSPIAKTLVPNLESSINFETTKNVFIEGDNLDGLKLIQEAYLEKIKVIYIDPPYNTGNDFIYPDDYSSDKNDYLKNTSQTDTQGNKMVANPQTNGRFHSDWLSMMFPRLKLARHLLRGDGVIFVSIGDNELGRLQLLMDAVFGSSNYLGTISRITKTTSDAGQFFAPSVDYVLCYGKDSSQLGQFKVPLSQELVDDYKKQDAKGKYKLVGFYQASLSLERSRNARYFIDAPDGTRCIPPENKRWRTVRETYDEFIRKDEIEFVKTKSSPLLDENGNQSIWNVYTKQYLDRRMGEGRTPRNFIDDAQNHLGAKDLSNLNIPFDFPKPVSLVKRLIEIGFNGDKEGIVLDFFAGSGTTAQAVYEMNANDLGGRRFIVFQLPEECDITSEAYQMGFKKISDITQERIRRSAKKVGEENPLVASQLDLGFRSFKIDSSNFSDTYYGPDEFTQDLLADQLDCVKPGRTSADLLFQLFLVLGVDLSLQIEKKSIKGKDVYLIDENSLIACFDSSRSVDEELAKELAKMQPLRVVFRDAGFRSDSVKINVEQIFKTMSPSTQVKCI